MACVKVASIVVSRRRASSLRAAASMRTNSEGRGESDGLVALLDIGTEPCRC